MRLVDSLRECRARARILCIGICRSEQQRSPAGNTSAGPENGKENVLRNDHNLTHSAALREAFRDSDHC
jgi:hypothetical protein